MACALWDGLSFTAWGISQQSPHGRLSRAPYCLRPPVTIVCRPRNRLAPRKHKALKDANRLRSLYDYRMASLSFDFTQVVNWLPDIVRSWLPWQWRPTVSNWLVWSGAFFVAGFLCFLLHFLLDR